MRRLLFRAVVIALCLISLLAGYQQPTSTSNDYKKQVVEDVEAMAKQSQVMVDMVFSFGELGFQEVETAKYLTGILRKEGFKIEHAIAGIPTAWIATWGSGKPIIALGSDVDCIPQASQKPGVAYHDPLTH
jgi:aminobenzoyl-glutamate utilization protein B